MSTTHKSPTDIPHARIKKQTRFSLIWLVPIVAAAVTVFLVFQQVRKIGPKITVQFEDGGGLQANQTVLRYRGVQVGSVKSVRLAKDTRHVEVVARLERSAAELAREGTVLWVVRPEVGAAGLRGLQTILSGVFIQLQPGAKDSPKTTKFVGAEEAPIIHSAQGGVEFVLRTAAIASLSEGSPVYYRGMEVGAVEYLGLNANSTAVDIHVLVKTNFAPLIRTDTVWWNAGGIKVNFHFFGVDVGAENLKSLVVGGIAFATPTNYGSIASNGTLFPLHDKAEDKWLKWTADIPLADAHPTASPSSLPAIDLNQAPKR